MRSISLALLCSTGLLVGACTEPVQAPPQKSVKVFSDITLSSAGRQKFQEFEKRSSDFFAAMYVTRNGKGGSRQFNAPTLQAAKKVAKATCEAVARANKDQTGCVLYATVEPRDPQATNGLPSASFSAFQKARSATKAGNFAALAMNDNGTFAVVGNSLSKATAQEFAIQSCAGEASKRRLQDNEVARKAKDRIGAYQCRVLIMQQL